MSLFSHPFKKLTLLAAFGGGYVLGAKAGRERYDQILVTANQVKEDPRVKQATARAEDIVRDTATKVTEDPRVKKVTEDPRVKDVVSRAEDILRDSGLKHDDEQAGSHRLQADDDAAPATAASPARDFPIDDEVVYSTGPDIEETIDELIDLDSAEQPLTERERDNG